MAAGYEMSIQDYLRVIFKRKWIILICAFTIFVTAIVYTSKLPPIYVAHGRVELKYHQTLATLLADALLYKGNELATATQFATSQPVMERAALKLKLVGPDAEAAQLHAAAAGLQAGVSATGDGQTNFITIGYSHSDPVYCAAVVNAVAAAFSEEYRLRNTRDADQIRLFLEEQSKSAEDRLLALENELLVMRQQRSHVELEPGVRVGLERAAYLEAEYEKVRVEAVQIRRQLETARNEVQAGRPEELTAEQVRRHPRIQAIRKELFEAEVELAARLRDLTARHPEVRAAEDRVRQLRVKLELTISEFFDERRANLETQYAALKAREMALERAIPMLQTMTDEIPRQQLEQARITRSIAMQERLFNFFRDKLEEKRYEDLINRDNVINVVEQAMVPTLPIYPNKRTNAMVGLAIGVMLGFALAFIVEAMDTSIGTIEDVERTTGLSVLGVIPSIAVDEEEAAAGDKSIVTFDPERARARDVKGRLMELDIAARKEEEEGASRFKPQLIAFHDPKSPISEAYRTLRTNVQFKGLLGSAKTLTVTSSGPQEGKTTTLCNLAVAMAQAGQKVLAVGCNLRRPALHKILGIRKKPGVTDILIGARTWQEVVQPTGIENLDAFCSGPIPPNPSELLGSPEMTELVRQLREAYDIVIFDCPPVLPVTDAAVLSAKVDSVLMVYYVGRAAREALLRAKVQLENVGARILGVVLNHIPAEGRLGYSYYYYHYHYYGESSRDDKNARVIKRRKS